MKHGLPSNAALEQGVERWGGRNTGAPGGAPGEVRVG